jgi:hypothetical protein
MSELQIRLRTIKRLTDTARKRFVDLGMQQPIGRPRRTVVKSVISPSSAEINRQCKILPLNMERVVDDHIRTASMFNPAIPIEQEQFSNPTWHGFDLSTLRRSPAVLSSNHSVISC